MSISPNPIFSESPPSGTDMGKAHSYLLFPYLSFMWTGESGEESTKDLKLPAWDNSSQTPKGEKRRNLPKAQTDMFDSDKS